MHAISLARREWKERVLGANADPAVESRCGPVKLLSDGQPTARGYPGPVLSGDLPLQHFHILSLPPHMRETLEIFTTGASDEQSQPPAILPVRIITHWMLYVVTSQSGQSHREWYNSSRLACLVEWHGRCRPFAPEAPMQFRSRVAGCRNCWPSSYGRQVLPIYGTTSVGCLRDAFLATRQPCFSDGRIESGYDTAKWDAEAELTTVHALKLHTAAEAGNILCDLGDRPSAGIRGRRSALPSAIRKLVKPWVCGLGSSRTIRVQMPAKKCPTPYGEFGRNGGDGGESHSPSRNFPDRICYKRVRRFSLAAEDSRRRDSTTASRCSLWPRVSASLG